MKTLLHYLRRVSDKAAKVERLHKQLRDAILEENAAKNALVAKLLEIPERNCNGFEPFPAVYQVDGFRITVEDEPWDLPPQQRYKAVNAMRDKSITAAEAEAVIVDKGPHADLNR